ncbi:MAG TPA: hypothetical protein VEO95_01110 [Chthoniobacteraceae bacterium]|nr:hypothetical protein [Chthoniobacteraceae bacterium]
MNLADVFTFLFVILGFLIVYVGYWLMAFGLFPGMTQRCSERICAAPVKTTLLGAVTLVPLVTLGFMISAKAHSTPVKILGIGVVVIALLGALFGASGLALRIGEGLKSARDEAEPWRRVLRGGIVLGLTFVMPFLGTFVLMPFAFISGFGAFISTLWQRAPQPVAVPAAAVTPPVSVTTP